MKETIKKSLEKLNHNLSQKIQNELFARKYSYDLACYYKLPLFFIKTGQHRSAEKTIQFIENKFLMHDGDFKTAPTFKSEKPEYAEYWSYMNGWILRAAYLINYQISEKAFQYFQNMHQKNRFLTNPFSQETDVLTVAHHGLVCLERGINVLSKESVLFLKWAFDKQTDLEHQFFLRFDHCNHYIDEYSSDKKMFFSIQKNTSFEQLYFMLAYPVAFLGLHYIKTNELLSLEYAKKYFDFIENCGDIIFTSRYSHKTAWAASILYAITKNPSYLEITQEIVSYFLAIQSPNGLWFEKEGLSTCLDQSAEIGCWLSEISKNIRQ